MSSLLSILLIIFYGINAINAKNAKSSWLKYPNSPVLSPGPNGTWDAWEIGTMTVCYEYPKQIYHMYYEAGPTSLANLEIGHATSKDGISWSKDPLNPVLRVGKEGNWDDGATWDPFCLYQDNIFKLWYGGERIGHKDFQWGYSISTDGTHFEKYSPNGENGQISFFNSSYAKVEDDHILYIPKENKYYMYYWQRAKEPNALMVAFGTNETNFDFDNAVFVNIKDEDQPCAYPQVFIDNNIWYLHYSRFVRPNQLGGRAGYAICPNKDGINFVAQNTSIIDGQDLAIIKIEEKLYYMYYGPWGYFDSEGDVVDLAILNGSLNNV